MDALIILGKREQYKTVKNIAELIVKHSSLRNVLTMMAGPEDEQLVSLAISRLLSTLDDLEPGASLPRCCSQSVIVKSLTFILFSTGLHQFFFRELLVSLHCVLGGSLLPSALRLVDKVFVYSFLREGPLMFLLTSLVNEKLR